MTAAALLRYAFPVDLSATQFGRIYRGILRNDSRLDGRVWVAVRTTGIYCLPSCRARKPRPENVSFYRSRAAVETAGFRPCRKCRPEVIGGRRAMEGARVRGWLATLASAETPVRELARANGASESRVYRAFRRHVGRGPRQARGEVRLRRACGLLREESRRVADVAYDAGFSSLATFYRWFRKLTGMTPTQFRRRNNGFGHKKETRP
jgi:AraC family transcriptional regulator of adaptative response / methylphosphotriester-DNA alkyltransferase methyltransferase